MTTDADRLSDDLIALVRRHARRVPAPEIAGVLCGSLLQVLSSAPAEGRMAFAEAIFAQLLDEVRRSLQ